MFGDKKKLPAAFQMSAYGEGLIAAIQSGLLPHIERDGVGGYDDDLFRKFWEMLQEKCTVELKE